MKTRHKILITVALASIAAWFMGCGAPAIDWTASDGVDFAPTVGKLSDAYRTSNDAYFYGGLPTRLTQIELRDLSTEGDIAMIHHDGDGLWHISIDPKFNPSEKQAEFSMIHEQCHQYDKINGIDEGTGQHGDNFQACMIRIADKGGFKDLW